MDSCHGGYGNHTSDCINIEDEQVERVSYGTRVERLRSACIFPS